MPNPVHGHLLIQQSGEAIESIATSCGNMIAKMTKDCGRVVGKWGAVLQKFDDDKRRDRPWETSFWACFEPIDLCLLTTFCPCITCGKTYHRLHNDGDMRDWKVVNVPCAAMGTAIFYSLGCVILPFMAWQTGSVRALGNIEGHCLIDWLKSWVCTCCVVIQNEKESKLLYARRGVHGGDGFVDQQYTGSAGAGQEMVLPGPVESGRVTQEEGVMGQVEGNAEGTAALPEAGVQEMGVERRDHVPSYLDGSFDGADDQVPAPVPSDMSSNTTPTVTSPRPGSWSPKSRTTSPLRADPPVFLTEPRSVARSRDGWMLRISDSRVADSPPEQEWLAQKLCSGIKDSPGEEVTTPESPVQDQPSTETSLHPQQTDGSADQTAIKPEPPAQDQDTVKPTSIEEHTDHPAEQTTNAQPEYSHTQNTANPAEASSSIGRNALTIIHEPSTDDQNSSTTPQQSDPPTAIREPVANDDDNPAPTETPQHTITSAERVAVLGSLVQEMVTLDQGSLDRLHLRSEWRWLPGDGGRAQG